MRVCVGHSTMVVCFMMSNCLVVLLHYLPCMTFYCVEWVLHHAHTFNVLQAI